MEFKRRGYDTSKYIFTGYAGNSADAYTSEKATSASNVYAYNTTSGTKASTTGTVYGVYDMAGGNWEYVAGCLSGYENEKFGVTTGDGKYVDLYTNSTDKNGNHAGAKTGDVAKETKGWNSDSTGFVYSNAPVFNNGGSHYKGVYAGIFAFNHYTGDSAYHESFRPVLTIE